VIYGRSISEIGQYLKGSPKEKFAFVGLAAHCYLGTYAKTRYIGATRLSNALNIGPTLARVANAYSPGIVPPIRLVTTRRSFIGVHASDEYLPAKDVSFLDGQSSCVFITSFLKADDSSTTGSFSLLDLGSAIQRIKPAEPLWGQIVRLFEGHSADVTAEIGY